MVPLIRSRQRVTVAPVDPAKLEVGDIVLARVAGTVYLHLVSAVDQARRRVQISNNHGRVNGWTSHDRVFGICVAVDDVPRSGADRKAVPAGGHRAGLGGVCPAGDAAESFVIGVVVAPDDVPADHAGLFLVAGVIGAVQREVPQRGELRLDAV
jgi:ApbE superfamily uncharacterized protein (UPF0280 family)